MVGAVLAHYRITERLGAGGMAVVWKARDLQLDRDVALKLLPSEDSTDAERVARFLREARCASALNHPNIVTIYEANTASDTPYIAMEYVRGVTLSHRLREQPIGIASSVDIAWQICFALAHAHNAGIVHRDLKPGNIMLTPEGTAKVLDFGIAKRTPAAPGAPDVTITAITAAGTTIGTLAYMSPEQALGDDVDARSDIFSLGVILYEMLTRTRPFDAKTSVTALRNLVYSDPRPLRELVPEVPDALAGLVERCLAKDRGNRYESAEEVSSVLGQILHSMTRSGTETVQTPLINRLRPRLFTRWRPLAAGSMLAVAIVAGLAWYTRAASSANTTMSVERSRASYVSDYEAAKAARGYLDRYDRKGNIDRAVEALETALRLNPEYPLAYAYLSEAYLRRNIVTPDAQWLRMASDAARKAVSLNPDLAAGHVALGDVLSTQGEHARGAESFRKAIELDPVNSRAYVGLAKADAATGSTSEAEAHFQKSIALAPRDWIPITEYGIFLYGRSRYQEAAKSWEAARTLADDNVRILRNLGGIYHYLDRYEEAASTFQRALEIEPSAQIYNNLGTLRFFQGRYSDAVTAFKHAVDRGGAGSYLYWGNLGDAYRWSPGQKDKSFEAYRHAIGLVRERIKTAPADPNLRGSLAVYLAKSGEASAALEQVGELEKWSKPTAGSLFKAALAAEVAGTRARALPLLQRALEAGYSVREVRNEPELIALRADARFHEMTYRLKSPGK